jgi:GR25 family glycosyltransferase involved in LPS biosynthesis
MKTYIIHYTPLKDRRAHMEQLLGEAWILENPEFIVAADREALTEADLAHFGGNQLKSADKSLILKHIAAWKKIEAISLIFEDDVILAPHFSDTLSKYVAALPSDFDLLFIGSGCGLHIPGVTTENVYPKCLEPTTWGGDGATRCTDSYVISPKCAALFAADIERPITKPIDFYMNDLCRKYKCKVFWAEPTIVTQGSETGLFEVSARK